MKKLISFQAAFSFAAIVLLGSCQKQVQDFDQEDPFFQNETQFTYTYTDTNIVEYSEAIHLAQKLTMNFMKTNIRNLNDRIIKNSFTLDDLNGLPAVYVFNYQEGGYSMISADLRFEPILAFVESGEISINDTLPSMYHQWIGYNIENIQLIRENLNPSQNELDQMEYSMFRWNTELEGFYIKNEFLHMKQYVPMPYPNCPPYFEQIGPLMTTKWGQNSTFNNLVPVNCPSRTSGKAPAGCVAVAVAQLLKYHNKLHSFFDYDLMPDAVGLLQTQQLMAKLGESDYLDMTYTCSLSYSTAPKVITTLENKFNYASGGVWVDYSEAKKWNVIDNIKLNMPVFFSGCEIKKTSWFRSSYDNCHAWISDGFRTSGTECYKHVWFHMNWGWDLGNDNGWYYHNEWNPETIGDFKYHPQMIYFIHP